MYFDQTSQNWKSRRILLIYLTKKTGYLDFEILKIILLTE